MQSLDCLTPQKRRLADLLIEGLTVAEAARAAQADYLLDATQTRQLIEQLQAL